MIYTQYKPTAKDLSEKFADFLQYDTIPHLKHAFSLMGRRFIGQPRKLQIANGIARYVREHPLDVLHRCDSVTLMNIKKMVEMGKGSCITIGEPNVYDLQIQEMELVLTYDDIANGCTELYLLDELHDLFAPHIEEAYRQPSDVLQQDMIDHMQKMAEEIKASDNPEKKMKEFLLEAMMYQLSFGIHDIKTSHARQLHTLQKTAHG